MTVTQKDRTPLLFIGVRFGGRIRTMKSGISRWVITGEDAVDFLTAIRPHVIVKATQIDAVLRRPDPAALDQELRQLKRT